MNEMKDDLAPSGSSSNWRHATLDPHFCDANYRAPKTLEINEFRRPLQDGGEEEEGYQTLKLQGNEQLLLSHLKHKLHSFSSTKQVMMGMSGKSTYIHI